MKNRTFWTRFFLAASIATAIAIFCFSAQQGPDSAALSEGVTLTVARIIRPGFDALAAPEQLAYIEKLGHVVRKCAHFGEFALLGFNLACWLRLKYLEKPRGFAPPRARSRCAAHLHHGLPVSPAPTPGSRRASGTSLPPPGETGGQSIQPTEAIQAV